MSPATVGNLDGTGPAPPGPPAGVDRGRVGWVFAVVACGALVGLLLWFLHPFPRGGRMLPPAGRPEFTDLAGIAGVFSMVDLAMLLALILVYVRTYRDTKARFALGLVLFLLALTVQSVTASLPVLAVFGFGPGALGGFFLVSAVFESLALAIFLYLSLE